ncbi:Quinone oxidoreductase [Geodia barretti]|uniref:Quinone oxidoreductase n=1 Tax=Geodia barretti TaxID=519541 RepID=A0AA35TVL8_GEOBA|nr:Quinone oxidoreductase [Geodia barretti]
MNELELEIPDVPAYIFESEPGDVVLSTYDAGMRVGVVRLIVGYRQMHAICIHEHGGPEALRYEEVAISEPGAGEARVRIEAAGLNYIDVYHRTGLYPSTNIPFTPGMEGAGVVEAVGSGVTEVNVGDRVAYAMHQGSYTEVAIVPSGLLVPLPDSIDTQSAAAAMLQGMTAHYLTRSTYPLSTGDTALIHAAAGGVGWLLIQMAKTLGARVLGTVSTPEKAELAKGAGADEVILYTQTDFEAEVKRLTDGGGVDVVYDSVAKTTFDKSLNCLRPRGYLVHCWQSSACRHVL